MSARLSHAATSTAWWAPAAGRRPGSSPAPTPEPGLEPGPGRTVLRIRGNVPPEIWNRLGTKLLGGWVPDDDGVPIMEEVESPSHSMPALLPLGSTREMSSHKGYGLACVVDILSGILSGGGYGIFPGRPYNSHMVAA
ncbi:MAG: Ldh family oxidoreductase, partial [Planctomycetes bacterium]|nr:Ldh family oxidoreductase [Planctomycetota bacterium]